MDPIARLETALAERYRIVRQLGRGGMATVYLADDLRHDRQVAVKVLRPELAAVVGAERFLAEIRTTAALQHPHILPLFDSGRVGNSDPESSEILFYVMPYVEGESLRDRLSRAGQFSLPDALRIASDVGAALDYAHRHGIIHRDIKPENILLTDGGAVLADFGIAVAVNSAGHHRLTETGLSIGTPHYMSPEQGAADRDLDGRSDIYSLGCVLYEMLAGEPPFTGPSAQAVLAKRMLEPVPHLSTVREVPPALERVVTRALARAPADRFATAGELVTALATAGAGGAEAAPTRPWRPRRTAAVVAVALAVMVVGWMLLAPPGRARSGAGTVTAIAVLPFQTAVTGTDSSYLSEGMTEGLIGDLAEVGSLKVISRHSGAVAQGSARSLTDLANHLGVQGVVHGSIRRSGDSVLVSVQFLRAPDSSLLFSKEYQTRLSSLPNLQRTIALAITGSIDARLRGSERSRLDANRDVDQRAYELYLRGRFHMDRDELEPARALFEESIRVSPQWAPPYVGLARYFTSLPFYTDTAPAEVLPQARAALARALELDESLPEAHAVNAYIRAYFEWDWRAAEREFRRAIELRPNYSDAYFSYGRFLASRRRLDEAIAQLEKALELEPLDYSLQANRALLDYFAGRYDEAERRLRETLRLDSTDIVSRWGMALVHEQKGRYAEALQILEPGAGASLNRRSSLGHAYALAGMPAKARGILAEFHRVEATRYVPSYWFAVVHAGLGEADSAFRYLERAYQERSSVMAYLLVDPRLSSLRDDPRFAALARKLGSDGIP